MSSDVCLPGSTSLFKAIVIRNTRIAACHTHTLVSLSLPSGFGTRFLLAGACLQRCIYPHRCFSMTT